jgi:hypothetical protein
MGLFWVIRMYSNSQIMSGFSVAQLVWLVTRKSMQAG